MDWKKLKAEYIAGGTSYRKLAEKYGVSRSKLQAKATREKWADLKSQAQAKTDSKLVESISEKESKKATDIVDVADKLLEKISEVISKVNDTKDIKNISSALRDIKEIKGVKSSADMREQEARIAKLQKEAEADDKDNNEIKVTIEGDLEIYSK